MNRITCAAIVVLAILVAGACSSSDDTGDASNTSSTASADDATPTSEPSSDGTAAGGSNVSGANSDTADGSGLCESLTVEKVASESDLALTEARPLAESTTTFNDFAFKGTGCTYTDGEDARISVSVNRTADGQPVTAAMFADLLAQARADADTSDDYPFEEAPNLGEGAFFDGDSLSEQLLVLNGDTLIQVKGEVDDTQQVSRPVLTAVAASVLAELD